MVVYISSAVGDARHKMGNALNGFSVHLVVVLIWHHSLILQGFANRLSGKNLHSLYRCLAPNSRAKVVQLPGQFFG